MLVKILTISKITLLEALRNRSLNMVVVFALVVLASITFFTHLSPGEEAKFILDFGLNSLLLFGALIAVFLFSLMIPGEIADKTIQPIMALPKMRNIYYYGKYLGGSLVILINIILMSAVFLVLFKLKGGVITGAILSQIFLTFLELEILGAIALLFSCFSSISFNISVTFLIFFIGHMQRLIGDVLQEATGVLLRYAGVVFATILPNLENFDARSSVIQGTEISFKYLASNTGYAVLYAALVLFIGKLIFEKKEF